MSTFAREGRVGWIAYHIIKCAKISWLCWAPVAQLDRAFACGAKGRRFESCRVYQSLKLELLSLLDLFKSQVLPTVNSSFNLAVVFCIGIRYLLGVNWMVLPESLRFTPKVRITYCLSSKVPLSNKSLAFLANKNTSLAILRQSLAAF